MGVDYSANFGFGIQVTDVTYSSLDEEETYLPEELEFLLQNSKYQYFEVGGDSYGGDKNKVYVVVDEEFLALNNLEQESEDLLNFLDAKGIEYIGKPRIVGGLHVY